MRQKQHESNDTFVKAWKEIESLFSRQDAEKLVDQLALETEEAIKINGWQNPSYCWSGGKDSQALRAVMDKIGIKPCVLGIDKKLEYPKFYKWALKNLPEGVFISDAGHDLPWLVNHPELLFPQTSAPAAQWFDLVQHKAQDLFFKTNKFDVMFFGRRYQDGNYLGRDRSFPGYKKNSGMMIYGPIARTTHEETIAITHYFYEMPPIYKWKNGFTVGTGVWPARQWTGSEENAWQEIYDIDPSIIQEAAAYFPNAAACLQKNGATQ